MGNVSVKFMQADGEPEDVAQLIAAMTGAALPATVQSAPQQVVVEATPAHAAPAPTPSAQPRADIVEMPTKPKSKRNIPPRLADEDVDVSMHPARGYADWSEIPSEYVRVNGIGTTVHVVQVPGVEHALCKTNGIGHRVSGEPPLQMATVCGECSKAIVRGHRAVAS